LPSSTRSNTSFTAPPSTDALFTRGRDTDGSTVTVTVSVWVLVPSLTVSENVRSVELLTDGAMNAGVAEVASSSVTLGPPVCVHA